MAWFELHQTRQRHPKTLRLAALIGQERRHACGFLDDLWSWGLDVARRDGRLEGMTADDIAAAMDYPRKKGKWLLDALVGSGYVDIDDDGTYRLHDWDVYAGRLNDRREKEAERKRTTRKTSAGRPADVREKSCATVPKPYHNRTVPKNDGGGGGNAPAREGDPEPGNPYGDGPPPGPTVEAYIANELPPLSPGNIDQLTALQEAGMQDDAIRLAVDVAAANNRRTWAYTYAILRRWLSDGVTTAGAAKAAEDRRQAGRARDAPRTPRADDRADFFARRAKELENDES